MGAEVNGFVHSWADLRMKVRGVEMVGFKAVKYGDKVTREKVYGARRHMIGFTRGKVEVDDATITMYEHEVRALLATLGQGWADVVIPEIIVQYGALGSAIHTDVLENCYLGGLEGGGEEGNTPFERELPFVVQRIKRNGLYIVAPDQ